VWNYLIHIVITFIYNSNIFGVNFIYYKYMVPVYRKDIDRKKSHNNRRLLSDLGVREKKVIIRRKNKRFQIFLQDFVKSYQVYITNTDGKIDDKQHIIQIQLNIKKRNDIFMAFRRLCNTEIHSDYIDEEGYINIRFHIPQGFNLNKYDTTRQVIKTY